MVSVFPFVALEVVRHEEGWGWETTLGRVSASSPWGWGPTLDEQGNGVDVWLLFHDPRGLAMHHLPTKRTFHSQVLSSCWHNEESQNSQEWTSKAAYNSVPSFGIAKRNLLHPQVLQFSQLAKSKIFFSKAIIGWIFFFFKGHFQGERQRKENMFAPVGSAWDLCATTL